MDQETKEALERAKEGINNTLKEDMTHVKSSLFKNPLVIAVLVVAFYALAQDLSTLFVGIAVGTVVLIFRAVQPKDIAKIGKAGTVATIESVKSSVGVVKKIAPKKKEATQDAVEPAKEEKKK